MTFLTVCHLCSTGEFSEILVVVLTFNAAVTSAFLPVWKICAGVLESLFSLPDVLDLILYE